MMCFIIERLYYEMGKFDQGRSVDTKKGSVNSAYV